MFCFNVHAPHFVIFIIELRGDDDDDDEREREREQRVVLLFQGKRLIIVPFIKKLIISRLENSYGSVTD